jgi:hypothetical protein
LGRSLKHLIEVVAGLAEWGIGFKRLTEQIDSTTPGGMLIFHVFGALAEFERDLIRERTQVGLAAARVRGRLGGRPKKLADAKQVAAARAFYEGGQTDIATIYATLYRYLKEDTMDPSASSERKGPVQCHSCVSLDEDLPDHSSLTRIRQQLGSDIFQRCFDARSFATRAGP